MASVDRRAIDREIAALAVPALGALIAEPLFLLADSAMVGHLGVASLAGLAVASSILQTIVGLMIFLAYATTPAVARRVGAGDRAGAITAGVSGMWLAVILGIVTLVVGLLVADPVVALFTQDAEVAAAAHTYLTVSLWGIPAMLLVLAGTGVLRGLQDTRTPLLVATLGFGANVALNAAFVYGLGWGIAGSAFGTVVVQWGMALVYAVIVLRAVLREQASVRPELTELIDAARSSWWLFLRTVGLRIGVLGTVWVAAQLGPVEVAAYQVIATVFTTFAFALDALAIAAQAMIAKDLGGERLPHLRAVGSRLRWWGWMCGLGCGVLVAAISPVLGYVFTSDAEVLAVLPATLLLMAVGMPLAGYVFVLDGVLIGASDFRYLAIASGITLLPLVPALAGVLALHPTGVTAALLIWIAYGFVFMGMRGLTLGLRARTLVP